MIQKRSLIWAIAIVLFFALAVWYESRPAQPQTATLRPEIISKVAYACDGGKTIDATYYAGQQKPPAAEGQPPIPGGSVDLVLNDGTAMTLEQTLSADGARYANDDESFIFWSKGDGALVMQNGQEKDYTHCVITQKQ